MLVAIDTGSRRPVKILRARPLRHFLYLLVRCKCGKKFGHRADRPQIVCYSCGRMAALREVRATRNTGRRPKPRPMVSAPKRSTTTRRTVSAPAKRRSTKSRA